MRKKKDPSEETFGEPVTAGQLSPMKIQQKEFGVTRVGGGYRMRDVDEFLDDITTSMTALVEENRRLREQAGNGAMIGAPDLEAVARQADEIIRRARDEAAQIVREARATPEAVPPVSSSVPSIGVGDRAAISAFLGREREFLQSLAGLVQGHAETVKGMARDARDAATAPAPTAPAPPAASAPTVTPPAKVVSEPSRSQDEPVRVGEPEPPAAGPTGEQATEPERRSQSQPQSEPQGQPTSELEEPVRIDEPEPEPATVGRSETDEAPEEGDRSLRELFWGEE
jgi:DivIVA domain-containing protein